MMTSAEPQCARAGQAPGKGPLKGQRQSRRCIAIVEGREAECACVEREALLPFNWRCGLILPEESSGPQGRLSLLKAVSRGEGEAWKARVRFNATDYI